MMFNRTNTTLTFSAALTGLALTVLTPMAHGHGNNPRNTSDTEPDTNSSPPQPPESGNPPVNAALDNSPQQPPVMLDSILDPGIVIGINFTASDSFDLLSQVVAEPVDLGMIVNPVEDFAPPITVDFFDGSGSGSITVPMSGVIPAPGTLALLGLAAASAGRRRRRCRH